MPKMKKTKKQRRRTLPSMGRVSRSSITNIRIPEIRNTNVSTLKIVLITHRKTEPKGELHSQNKKYIQAPFLVLQLVTNRGLQSVPGRTKQHQEGPNKPIMVLPLFVPSKYSLEFSTCDKLKYQKGTWKLFFFFWRVVHSA